MINLKEVPQVDSSGLGAVVGLVSARTRGCQLEVVNASHQIRDFFGVLTNLLSLLSQPAPRQNNLGSSRPYPSGVLRQRHLS